MRVAVYARVSTEHMPTMCGMMMTAGGFPVRLRRLS